MSLDKKSLKVANNFELLQPLPDHQTRLRRDEVIKLLQETVRLQRLSRYTVLATVAVITPTESHGGDRLEERASGILYCLDAVAPRLDKEPWSAYTNQHLEMPDWLNERLG